jgi:aminoglycoside phosphotransferase family enzyme
MSHDHKIAIEKIITLCENSRQPTRRIERIYDVALTAMGLTFNQREDKINQLIRQGIENWRNRFFERRDEKERND